MRNSLGAFIDLRILHERVGYHVRIFPVSVGWSLSNPVELKMQV